MWQQDLNSGRRAPEPPFFNCPRRMLPAGCNSLAIRSTETRPISATPAWGWSAEERGALMPKRGSGEPGDSPQPGGAPGQGLGVRRVLGVLGKAARAPPPASPASRVSGVPTRNPSRAPHSLHAAKGARQTRLEAPPTRSPSSGKVSATFSGAAQRASGLRAPRPPRVETGSRCRAALGAPAPPPAHLRPLPAPRCALGPPLPCTQLGAATWRPARPPRAPP